MAASDLPTAVVCDTTAYLPKEKVESLGIRLVSLYVVLDGRQDAESELGDYDDFYDRLRRSSSSATTSQPSVGDFEDVFRPILESGRGIASFHLSAGISGTFESACAARDKLVGEGASPDLIQIVDSRSACGGLGLVVMAAQAAAAEHEDPAAVVERAQRAREALKMWFAVDTLEYLRRGGRIGAASALIGGALKVKPILTLGEEITPVERVRTSARVRERLIDYARERKAAGAESWVVQHIQAAEAADGLIADASEVFGHPPEFVSEIGPVIGAHVGPGLLGIGATTL